MAKNYQQRLERIANPTDEAEAVRVMAEILVSTEGRGFISRLERKDAELSIGILDRVSCELHPPLSRPQTVRQGIMEHKLGPPEKNAFFVALRRLAECHQLLPDRVRMKGKLEASDEVHASGGFGDIRSQQYMGRPVAVKTPKVLGVEDLQKMKKVIGSGKDKRLEAQKTRKVGINGVFALT